MGVEYSLNDPAKGECFDFGKGWHGLEASTDCDPAFSPEPPPGCYRIGTVGYRWTPLTSRDDALRYVTTHFWFLEREDHSPLCMQLNDYGVNASAWKCIPQCSFNAPDMEYANLFADKLWAWLEGRDQSQLDVNHDSGDDIHYHDASDLQKYVAAGFERCFRVTGSRYEDRKT